MKLHEVSLFGGGVMLGMGTLAIAHGYPIGGIIDIVLFAINITCWRALRPKK